MQFNVWYKLEKRKEITHDLNRDLHFTAHTINCVCHSIRSMFRVLGIYNFGGSVNAQWEKHCTEFNTFCTAKYIQASIY